MSPMSLSFDESVCRIRLGPVGYTEVGEPADQEYSCRLSAFILAKARSASIDQGLEACAFDQTLP